MKLFEDTLCSFRVRKSFPSSSKITSFDFHEDGDMFVSCCEDQISIFNASTGTYKKTLNCKKYGVENVRFAREKRTVIHCSNKIDNAIRHLNLEDSKFIRYFTGHSRKVISLSVSNGDVFLSSSLDRTVRLWDLRSPNCQGLLNLPSPAVATYDPDYSIFATAINNKTINLYDVRTFDKAPFATFNLEKDGFNWTNLKFSPNGRHIIITTDGTVIRMIDAFNGMLLQTFKGYANDEREPIEASFSPDSQYIFSGSSDRCIHVWNAFTGEKLCVLETNHTGTPQCVQFNPMFMMIASACDNLAFYLPDTEETLPRNVSES